MIEDDEPLDVDPWGYNDGDPIVAPDGEITSVPYRCAACGEANATELDPGGGLQQRYTEDCWVCCRPNLLTITIDPDTRVVTVVNELEYE